MGPGGGDRAQGRLFRSEDEIKREEESASPSELTPLPGGKVPGCGAGQQGAQRSDLAGRDGPEEGRAAVPEEAQLRSVCRGGGDVPGRSQVRAEGPPAGWQGAGRGWGACSGGTGPWRPDRAPWRMLTTGCFDSRSGGVAAAPGEGEGAGPCRGPGSSTGVPSLASSPWARVPALSPGVALCGLVLRSDVPTERVRSIRRNCCSRRRTGLSSLTVPSVSSRRPLSLKQRGGVRQLGRWRPARATGMRRDELRKE